MGASASPARHIVIVDGGFSGAALARALIDLSSGPLEITVIEPRPSLGRGVAYSTTNARHFMNGPTVAFSLHPDDENHFTRWVLDFLTRHAPDIEEWRYGDALFVPRSLYGDYVAAELANTTQRALGGSVRHMCRLTAVRVATSQAEAKVWLAGDSEIGADHVVLATGVASTSLPAVAGALAGHSRYLHDPWDLPSYAAFAGAGRIAIIGAGLTMLDALASLDREEFRGEVLAISRRGLTVQQNRMTAAWPGVLHPKDLPRTSRSLLRRVQHARQAIRSAGGDAQSLADAIAPHMTTMWRHATDLQRQIYLRRLRVYWENTARRRAGDGGAGPFLARRGTTALGAGAGGWCRRAR